MTEQQSSLKGTYKLEGWTKNSSDKNTTQVKNFVIVFRDGKISAAGTYNEGSNYNPQLQARFKVSICPDCTQ